MVRWLPGKINVKLGQGHKNVHGKIAVKEKASPQDQIFSKDLLQMDEGIVDSPN